MLNATDYVKDSRQAINDNFAAVISDFSGTVFPTNNLTGGMKCNRTDRKKVYVLQQDLLTWTEFFDYNNNKITVPNAANATNATNDGNGDNISETYLKEAVTNISESNGTVTVTKSDGSSFTFSRSNFSRKSLVVARMSTCFSKRRHLPKRILYQCFPQAEKYAPAAIAGTWKKPAGIFFLAGFAYLSRRTYRFKSFFI